MRNFVAKHARMNRASTHKPSKGMGSYSRKWSLDWDEIEPPKTLSKRVSLDVQ